MGLVDRFPVTVTAYSGSSLCQQDTSRLRSLAAEYEVQLEFRPPIVRGDLLEIPTSESWRHRVLMLDGHFGQDLSVSVAEIREYLQRGMYLSGAASMGALRAVECRNLGMVRHGWIAEEYLRGGMSADADLALLMDPDTWKALTVPIANLRWLMKEMQKQDELSPEHASVALSVAEQIHYSNRRPDVLIRALNRTLPAVPSRILTHYLAPENMQNWDRKRLDAVEAVECELRNLAGVRPH